MNPKTGEAVEAVSTEPARALHENSEARDSDRGDRCGKTGAPALELRRVTKTFGRTVAVDEVSFTVGPDEIVCLVGPSGCGKSTLLRVIAGLTRVDSGEVFSYGRLLEGATTSVPPERRRVGIVFQEAALFPNLTVQENVGFGLERSARRGPRVREMLEVVGLAHLAHRYPHELSGGERQRVALARALAPAPSVMLLDEPFANLDQNLRVRLRGDVVSILRRTHTPAVLVTHDQAEALALADRLIVMRDGRVEQLGFPDEVFHRPATRFVAEFLGEADFIPATFDGGMVHTELGSLAASGSLPAGAAVAEIEGRPAAGYRGAAGPDSSQAVTAGETFRREITFGWEMMTRPDDIVVEIDSTVRAGASGGEGRVPATVVASEFQGGYRLVRLRLPSGAEVRARVHHALGVTVGAEVWVRFDDHVDPVLFPPGSAESAGS